MRDLIAKWAQFTLVDPFNVVARSYNRDSLSYVREAVELAEERFYYGDTFRGVKETSFDIYKACAGYIIKSGEIEGQLRLTNCVLPLQFWISPNRNPVRLFKLYILLPLVFFSFFTEGERRTRGCHFFRQDFGENNFRGYA